MNTAKIYWLLDDNSIGIMPRPLGSSYLAGEILALKALQVKGLCSLLEDKEIKQVELESEGSLCKHLGIDFWHFPISDAQPPKDIYETHQLILELVKHAQAGKKLVLHCYGGIGRSGTIALAVMMHLGHDLEEMIKKATLIRGFDVPQTPSQENWLRGYRLFLGK